MARLWWAMVLYGLPFVGPVVMRMAFAGDASSSQEADCSERKPGGDTNPRRRPDDAFEDPHSKCNMSSFLEVFLPIASMPFGIVAKFVS